MIKAVIFEMDGVIIDSEYLTMERNREIFKELGINVPDSLQDRLQGMSSYSKWSMIKNEFGIAQDIEEIMRMERDKTYQYLKESINNIKPVKGVYKLIQGIHDSGVKLAIISTLPLDIIKLILHSFNMDSFFTIMISGDDVKKSKPDPEIYTFAAEKLCLPRGSCLAVEDSTNGVAAAKNAGMKCIGYRNKNLGNQDLSLADIVVDSFENLVLIM